MTILDTLERGISIALVVVATASMLLVYFSSPSPTLNGILVLLMGLLAVVILGQMFDISQ